MKIWNVSCISARMIGGKYSSWKWSRDGNEEKRVPTYYTKWPLSKLEPARPALVAGPAARRPDTYHILQQKPNQ